MEYVKCKPFVVKSKQEPNSKPKVESKGLSYAKKTLIMLYNVLN